MSGEVARVLETDLRTLAQEARRGHPAVKVEAERVLVRLRGLDPPLEANDPRRGGGFLSPFLLACSHPQAPSTLLLPALQSMQRLVNWGLVDTADPLNILQVLRVQGSHSASEVRLKVLQTLPLLLAPVDLELSEPVLLQTVELGLRLLDDDVPVLHAAADATIRQVVNLAMERVFNEVSHQRPIRNEGASAPVRGGGLEGVLHLLQDIGSATECHPLRWLRRVTLPPRFAWELFEQFLVEHGTHAAQESSPVEATLESVLFPSLLRALRRPGDPAILVRVLRVARAACVHLSGVPGLQAPLRDLMGVQIRATTECVRQVSGMEAASVSETKRFGAAGVRILHNAHRALATGRRPSGDKDEEAGAGSGDARRGRADAPPKNESTSTAGRLSWSLPRAVLLLEWWAALFVDSESTLRLFRILDGVQPSDSARGPSVQGSARTVWWLLRAALLAMPHTHLRTLHDTGLGAASDLEDSVLGVAGSSFLPPRGGVRKETPVSTDRDSDGTHESAAEEDADSATTGAAPGGSQGGRSISGSSSGAGGMVGGLYRLGEAIGWGGGWTTPEGKDTASGPAMVSATAQAEAKPRRGRDRARRGRRAHGLPDEENDPTGIADGRWGSLGSHELTDCMAAAAHSMGADTVWLDVPTLRRSLDTSRHSHGAERPLLSVVGTAAAPAASSSSRKPSTRKRSGSGMASSYSRESLSDMDTEGCEGEISWEEEEGGWVDLGLVPCSLATLATRAIQAMGHLGRSISLLTRTVEPLLHDESEDGNSEDDGAFKVDREAIRARNQTIGRLVADVAPPVTRAVASLLRVVHGGVALRSILTLVDDWVVVCARWEMGDLRDALLWDVCAASVPNWEPPAGSLAVDRPLEGIVTRMPHSHATKDGDHKRGLLRHRHVLLFKTLFNLMQQLGAQIQSTWVLLLDTLEHLQGCLDTMDQISDESQATGEVARNLAAVGSHGSRKPKYRADGIARAFRRILRRSRKPSGGMQSVSKGNQPTNLSVEAWEDQAGGTDIETDDDVLERESIATAETIGYIRTVYGHPMGMSDLRLPLERRDGGKTSPQRRTASPTSATKPQHSHRHGAPEADTVPLGRLCSEEERALMSAALATVFESTACLPASAVRHVAAALGQLAAIRLDESLNRAAAAHMTDTATTASGGSGSHASHGSYPRGMGCGEVRITGLAEAVAVTAEEEPGTDQARPLPSSLGSVLRAMTAYASELTSFAYAAGNGGGDDARRSPVSSSRHLPVERMEEVGSYAYDLNRSAAAVMETEAFSLAEDEVRTPVAVRRSPPPPPAQPRQRDGSPTPSSQPSSRAPSPPAIGAPTVVVTNQAARGGGMPATHDVDIAVPASLRRLVDVVARNSARLAVLWDIVAPVMEALAHAPSRRLRGFAVDAAVRLATAGIAPHGAPTSSEEAATEPLPHATLLAPLVRLWSSPFLDTRCAVLSSLDTLVDTCGWVLDSAPHGGGWAVILGLLASACDVSLPDHDHRVLYGALPPALEDFVQAETAGAVTTRDTDDDTTASSLSSSGIARPPRALSLALRAPIPYSLLPPPARAREQDPSGGATSVADLRSRASALVRLAFRCLQRIGDDCLSLLPASLLAYTGICFSGLARQSAAVNVSLSAVTLLWNLLDEVGRRPYAAGQGAKEASAGVHAETGPVELDGTDGPATPLGMSGGGAEHPEPQQDRTPSSASSPSLPHDDKDSIEQLWMRLVLLLRDLVWGAKPTPPRDSPVAQYLSLVASPEREEDGASSYPRDGTPVGESPTRAQNHDDAPWSSSVRAEVRDAAAQALFNSIATHGRIFSLALWEEIVHEALLPLGYELTALSHAAAAAGGGASVEGMVLGRPRGGAAREEAEAERGATGGDESPVRARVHHSHDTEEKLWNSTRVLCHQGLARVIVAAFPKLQQAPWLHDVWSAILALLERAAVGRAGALTDEDIDAGAPVPPASEREPQDVAVTATQALRELALQVAVPAGPAERHGERRYGTTMRVVDGALVRDPSPVAGEARGSNDSDDDGEDAAKQSTTARTAGAVDRAQLWRDILSVLHSIATSRTVALDDDEHVAVALLQTIEAVLEGRCAAAPAEFGPGDEEGLPTTVLGSDRAGPLFRLVMSVLSTRRRVRWARALSKSDQGMLVAEQLAWPRLDIATSAERAALRLVERSARALADWVGAPSGSMEPPDIAASRRQEPTESRSWVGKAPVDSGAWEPAWTEILRLALRFACIDELEFAPKFRRPRPGSTVALPPSSLAIGGLRSLERILRVGSWIPTGALQRVFHSAVSSLATSVQLTRCAHAALDRMLDTVPASRPGSKVGMPQSASEAAQGSVLHAHDWAATVRLARTAGMITVASAAEGEMRPASVGTVAARRLSDEGPPPQAQPVQTELVFPIKVWGVGLGGAYGEGGRGSGVVADASRARRMLSRTQEAAQHAQSALARLVHFGVTILLRESAAPGSHRPAKTHRVEEMLLSLVTTVEALVNYAPPHDDNADTAALPVRPTLSSSSSSSSSASSSAAAVTTPTTTVSSTVSSTVPRRKSTGRGVVDALTAFPTARLWRPPTGTAPPSLLHVNHAAHVEDERMWIAVQELEPPRDPVSLKAAIHTSAFVTMHYASQLWRGRDLPAAANALGWPVASLVQAGVPLEDALAPESPGAVSRLGAAEGPHASSFSSSSSSSSSLAGASGAGAEAWLLRPVVRALVHGQGSIPAHVARRVLRLLTVGSLGLVWTPEEAKADRHQGPREGAGASAQRRSIARACWGHLCALGQVPELVAQPWSREARDIACFRAAEMLVRFMAVEEACLRARQHERSGEAASTAHGARARLSDALVVDTLWIMNQLRTLVQRSQSDEEKQGRCRALLFHAACDCVASMEPLVRHAASALLRAMGQAIGFSKADDGGM